MTSHDYTRQALSDQGFEAKDETRLHALNIVKHSSFLWSRDQQALRCDWMELAGTGAPTLQLLLNLDAIEAPARFIGVDTDETVIEGCMDRYGPEAPAHWHHGPLIPALRRLGPFDQVGVLVYDAFRAVQGERTIQREVRSLARFAQRQRDRLGEFLLVMNVDGSPRYRSNGTYDSYRKLLSDAFEMQVEPEALHPYVSRQDTMVWTALRWGF
jgi:hypothetical protein